VTEQVIAITRCISWAQKCVSYSALSDLLAGFEGAASSACAYKSAGLL